jgi:hypothetical protein
VVAALQLCCIRHRRYPTPVRTYSTSPSVFRLLLTGLLLAAVLIKPVLAFDCVFADAPQQNAEQGVSAAVVNAFAPNSGDDCCPFQDCHDCCAHTTAVLSQHRQPLVAKQVATISLPATTPFRPLPLRTVFRPPIAC